MAAKTKRFQPPPGTRRFEHLVSTIAKTELCPVCRTEIWAAYDGGLKVKADKVELTPEQEVTVLAQGRKTFNRRAWAGMYYRTAADILDGRLPGVLVHPQHQCKGKNR